MTRRRRALLIGTALALCAVTFAALHTDAGVDEALVPAPAAPIASTTAVTLPLVRPFIPTDDVTTEAPSTTEPAPSRPGAAPATTRTAPATTRPPSGSPTTAPAGVDPPVLLANAAPSPAEPQRPSGGQAISRQRFVTIDAKATVDQLMGNRAEPIANGYRREGKTVKVLLFDSEPVLLEPVAPYVRETTTVGPVANGATGGAAAPTTFSWMGTGKLAETTVTASLSVSDDTHGTYRLVGTVSTSGSVPPLLIDWVDADRYALTEIDAGAPCVPDVVSPTTPTTTPTTDASAPPTTAAGCAG